MTPKGIGALENYNERRFEQDSLHLNRFHMRQRLKTSTYHMPPTSLHHIQNVISQR